MRFLHSKTVQSRLMRESVCPAAVVHMQSRNRLRAKYGLMEKPCGDCCVTYFW